MSKVRKKRTIFKMLLVPLAVLMLVQSMLTVGIIVFRRTTRTIQDYSVSMMSRLVENRTVILQNDITRRWAAIAEQDKTINLCVEEILAQKKMTIGQALSSKTVKMEIMERLFPDFVTMVENSTTTGIFFVFTDGETENAGEFDGFFLRDSNPRMNSAKHSDLLMERGDKQLSREFDVSMDTRWTTSFRMSGRGKNAAEDFFYEPWYAAEQNPEAGSAQLGYWSKPFILGPDERDSHQMITYSVPLRYDGRVYAVMGVEVAVSYLYDYLPIEELNEEKQSGYAIAYRNQEGSYTPLLGKGVLYNTVKDHSENFLLNKTGYDNLKLVDDVKMGRQKIYAVRFPLTMYSGHVPYEDTEWYVMGFNNEESLFGMGRQLYVWMIAAILIGLVFGLILLSLVVHTITVPIKYLMKCISGGRNGLQEFRQTDILEVDALYDVVHDLTERQKVSENMILEEKELYRVALETTKDVFFSYDMNKQTGEVLNGAAMNSSWNGGKLGAGLLDINTVYEDDREQVQELLEKLPDVWDLEFRMKLPDTDEYIWISMTGNVICDTEGKRWKVVGRFRNIQEQKEREAQEQKKFTTDGVTGFYSYTAGLTAVRHARKTQPDGALICLSLENLHEINEQNGITFGDMVLEEIGQIIREKAGRKSILVRYNSEDFCIWLPGKDEAGAAAFVTAVREQIRAQFDPEIFKIVLYAGIVIPQPEERMRTFLRRAKLAQIMASESADERGYFFGSEEKPGSISDVAWPGEQLVTSEYGSNVKLMSLAVMLFGRGSNLAAQMRLMFRKMGQYYGATDVILAMIQPDFHSIYEEYEWHSGLSESRKGRAVTYREEEWEELSACLETTSCLSWNEEKPLPETLAKFCRSEHAAGGYAVPLYDNGSVMGMLSIFNLSRRAPENGEERKELLETCGVIQGQLNQQRHDLASKAKSEFLSRMSHEIRTPMNGIIGMTAIALQHGQTPQKVHDCLSKIQMSSNYLLGLINDILDISKIESGKMQLAPEDFSMTELIDTVRELIRPQAERKSMSFELDIHMVHDWFVADKMRISQILINLLGNAVKFTEEHGTVVLTIREETQNGKQSEIFFSVRDNGVGIAQEDQERVFRAFEQASGYHSSGMKGTGLGLSISSRLIKLMGSKINLKSAPGEGSDFYFTLSVPLGECRNEDEKEEELSFEGRRILVVEDNELNAEIAQSILEECHFTVDCVHDGAQAVKRMEETAPGTYDLILMDIMMPVMDGLEATRTIRAMEREDCKTIPIIAMSANVFDDDLKKSVECGMNGHLSKPVEIDKMYKLLQKILK